MMTRRTRLTTRRTPRQKALWYRQKYGNKPPTKPRRRIKPVSNRNSSRQRAYNARVAEWKAGKLCACAGKVHEAADGKGYPICSRKAHACEDNHHSRGKIGSLLMDERFWVPVCRKAHDFLTAHTIAARALGMTCELGGWNDPVPKEEAA